MNIEQYKALQPLLSHQCNALESPSSRELISVSELDNPRQDRTLLHGYDCEKHSFHVYLKDGLIHKAIYAFPDQLIFSTSGDSVPCSTLAPDKRAYPAATDAQFAKLLIDKGHYVPYTTFDERDDISFHGKLIEELKPIVRRDLDVYP